MTDVDPATRARQREPIAPPLLRLTTTTKASRVPVWIRRAITPILLLLVWEMSVRLGWISDQVLAPPSALPATVSGLWESGDLQEGILVSATRAGLGLFFGTVIGVVVAAIARAARTIAA